MRVKSLEHKSQSPLFRISSTHKKRCFEPPMMQAALGETLAWGQDYSPRSGGSGDAGEEHIRYSSNAARVQAIELLYEP